jgi:hypothetical protein
MRRVRLKEAAKSRSIGRQCEEEEERLHGGKEHLVATLCLTPGDELDNFHNLCLG